MAYAMTKRGSLDNCVTYEFICDTVADMNAIEDRYRTIGSTAVVLQGDAGLEVYISGSDKTWTSLSVINSSGSGSVPSGGGLSFHICGQDELDANGLPDVSEPDEVTFYLVPAADETTGNIYDEYIYVDDEWERFGSGGTTNIDLSAYAPKANPEFTGSVSLDRYTGSTVGELSVSLGRQTKATGDYSFAEGNYTTASGSGSHAEGQSSIASGYNSHAEGLQTKARGRYSHAEGQHTTGNDTTTYGNITYYYGASGESSHSEGKDTIAHGNYSHAEGESTKALAAYSHAEGTGTVASGEYSHAEGSGATASGIVSHAEGSGTIASGPQSHTEGGGTKAVGPQSHAEGAGTTASGQQSHAEGASTTASGYYSHAEGVGTKASGDTSHAEGSGTIASGPQSHTEGGGTTASGSASHAEGVNTTASGDGSHAEGGSAKALGNNSHAEGSNTTAYGLGAHAEGGASATYNSYAHAEGNGKAYGQDSHAEGSGSIAMWQAAHAEGILTTASGLQSHAEGYYTIAIGSAQHVSGLYNVADSATAWVASTSYDVGDLVSKDTVFTDASNTQRTRTVIYKCITANSDSEFDIFKWRESGIYAEIIGNGTAENARSNARALDWNGNEYLKGDLYVGCNADSTGGTKVLTASDLPDTSSLAPKASPIFTQSISLGRRANTTVGSNSVAAGENVTASGSASFAEGSGTTASGAQSHAAGAYTTASGSQSHAEGSGTTASGSQSHTEGGGTTASGSASHAEGAGTRASGAQSHAEGAGTFSSGNFSHAEGSGTITLGMESHAEGGGTIASGRDSHSEGFLTQAIGAREHVSGQYNVIDSAPAWVASTSYNVGDLVSKDVAYTNPANQQTTYTCIYKCKTANSDATFNSSKWTESGIYAEVIGNGTADNARSNARTLDWEGNERLMGDLYVGCNADSTGGTKLARIPDAPSTDGTYTLQCVVTNGEPTYTWISTGA